MPQERNVMSRNRNRLSVHNDGKPCYDIVYSTDTQVLRRELDRLGLRGRRALIVTDTNVAPLYARQISALFEPAASVYAIPAGEENKTLDQVRALLRFMVENHFDRNSYLAALGGGVVGDLTGFAASIYMRGIDFIQIPTTLLAQADSSIGGKTGVDFDGYKNMVGAFKMPRLVYANVDFTKSLDARQYASGFAEIMKSALIRDCDYYVWLIHHMVEIRERDSETLSEMLYRSNEIKKAVVEADPYEKGERMLLNFGHTIGHALEKYLNFEMLHGECVALGCVAASYISYQRGYLTWEEYYEVRDMFVPFGLPISLESIDAPEVLRLTKSDKKAVDGHVRFVLLRGIGDAFVDRTVTDEEILSGIREIDFSAKTGEGAGTADASSGCSPAAQESGDQAE